MAHFDRQNPGKVGALLAELRKEQRLSQGALARLAGVSRGAISMMERGETAPRPDTLEWLARALATDTSGRVDDARFSDFQTRLFRAAGYPVAPATRATPATRAAQLLAQYPELSVQLAQVADDLEEDDLAFLTEAVKFIRRKRDPGQSR